jgi:RHS repeat-associated protein
MCEQPKRAHSAHSLASSLNLRPANQAPEHRTKYRYDPFGNLISKSGSLADANVYRFSSKECHSNSVMYYYGYRFYDPNLQRWANRDPVMENGGINLYECICNRPSDACDPWGWSDYNKPPVLVSGPNLGFPNPFPPVRNVPSMGPAFPPVQPPTPPQPRRRSKPPTVPDYPPFPTRDLCFWMLGGAVSASPGGLLPAVLGAGGGAIGVFGPWVTGGPMLPPNPNPTDDGPGPCPWCGPR